MDGTRKESVGHDPECPRHIVSLLSDSLAGYSISRYNIARQ